ncbi:MAG: phosphate ABC transporter substrate-binding protein PstS [Candidatus Ancillula trichonymphae]|jgi:phosphate transport system substrate-binding protein|nr:phosphate ABC transporter substrate-binding protein PstS [Candidatus Ancillula trichonymphae]
MERCVDYGVSGSEKESAKKSACLVKGGFKSLKLFSLVTVGSFAAVAALTGCSNGDQNGSFSSLLGQFAGSGASSQSSAVDVWRSGFQAKNGSASVTYDGKGSGGGRKDLIDGAVLFVGSDTALTDDEVKKAKEGACKGGNVVEVPVYISPIAIVYNLDGVKDLKLDSETIAKIFDGAITKWNDAAIKAENPGVNLPNKAITPVHRSDQSGTTENFTDYLAKTAGNVWKHPASGSWPNNVGQSGQETSGLVNVVSQSSGTIGYADASKVGKLSTVAVKVGSSYVKYSVGGAAKLVEDSPYASSDGRYVVKLNRKITDAKYYPLVLVSYQETCSVHKDQRSGDFVRSWLGYITSEEAQKKATEEAGSAPISATIRDRIKKSIESIK